jgi:hypothetical protein
MLLKMLMAVLVEGLDGSRSERNASRPASRQIGQVFICDSFPVCRSESELPNKCSPDLANEPVASSGFELVEDDAQQWAVPRERFVEATSSKGRAAGTCSAPGTPLAKTRGYFPSSS